jgi:hypothetical protein
MGTLKDNMSGWLPIYNMNPTTFASNQGTGEALRQPLHSDAEWLLTQFGYPPYEAENIELSANSLRTVAQKFQRTPSAFYYVVLLEKESSQWCSYLLSDTATRSWRGQAFPVFFLNQQLVPFLESESSTQSIPSVQSHRKVSAGDGTCSQGAA